MEFDGAAAHRIEFVDRAATHGLWAQLFSIEGDVHRISARFIRFGPGMISELDRQQCQRHLFGAALDDWAPG